MHPTTLLMQLKIIEQGSKEQSVGKMIWVVQSKDTIKKRDLHRPNPNLGFNFSLLGFFNLNLVSKFKTMQAINIFI